MAGLQPSEMQPIPMKIIIFCKPYNCRGSAHDWPVPISITKFWKLYAFFWYIEFAQCWYSIYAIALNNNNPTESRSSQPQPHHALRKKLKHSICVRNFPNTRRWIAQKQHQPQSRYANRGQCAMWHINALFFSAHCSKRSTILR